MIIRLQATPRCSSPVPAVLAAEGAHWDGSKAKRNHQGNSAGAQALQPVTVPDCINEATQLHFCIPGAIPDQSTIQSTRQSNREEAKAPGCSLQMHHKQGATSSCQHTSPQVPHATCDMPA